MASSKSGNPFTTVYYHQLTKVKGNNANNNLKRIVHIYIYCTIEDIFKSYFILVLQSRTRKAKQLVTFASSFLLLSLCRFFLGVVSASRVHVSCTWAREVAPTVTNHTTAIQSTAQTTVFHTRKIDELL